MTPENFCYWLQGYFEVSDSRVLTEKQVEIVKNHLNLVFVHSIDPKASAHISNPKEAKKLQEKLNEVHDGTSTLPGFSQVPGLTTYRC